MLDILLHPFLNWETEKKSEEGILVAVSQNQEHLIPWFYKNYKKHNDYPILFIDLGMSKEAVDFCQKKGDVKKLNIPETFFSKEKDVSTANKLKWKRAFSKNCFKSRPYFHKKPFCLLQTFFETTIWLDLDCEVKKNLNPLFLKAQKNGFAIAKEAPLGQEFYKKFYLKKEQEIIYNSGVIAYQKYSDIISNWTKKTLLENHLFFGDQDILSRIIYEKKYNFSLLDEKYNCSFRQKKIFGIFVKHYTGWDGKKLILKKILKNKDLQVLIKMRTERDSNP